MWRIGASKGLLRDLSRGLSLSLRLRSPLAMGPPPGATQTTAIFTSAEGLQHATFTPRPKRWPGMNTTEPPLPTPSTQATWDTHENNDWRHQRSWIVLGMSRCPQTGLDKGVPRMNVLQVRTSRESQRKRHSKSKLVIRRLLGTTRTHIMGHLEIQESNIRVIRQRRRYVRPWHRQKVESHLRGAICDFSEDKKRRRPAIRKNFFMMGTGPTLLRSGGDVTPPRHQQKARKGISVYLSIRRIGKKVSIAIDGFGRVAKAFRLIFFSKEEVCQDPVELAQGDETAPWGVTCAYVRRYKGSPNLFDELMKSKGPSFKEKSRRMRTAVYEGTHTSGHRNSPWGRYSQQKVQNFQGHTNAHSEVQRFCLFYVGDTDPADWITGEKHQGRDRINKGVTARKSHLETKADTIYMTAITTEIGLGKWKSYADTTFSASWTNTEGVPPNPNGEGCDHLGDEISTVIEEQDSYVDAPYHRISYARAVSLGTKGCPAEYAHTAQRFELRNCVLYRVRFIKHGSDGRTIQQYMCRAMFHAGVNAVCTWTYGSVVARAFRSRSNGPPCNATARDYDKEMQNDCKVHRHYPCQHNRKLTPITSLMAISTSGVSTSLRSLPVAREE
ncbi:hypothetical protein Tco_0045183 [Tanacetum coccineum]